MAHLRGLSVELVDAQLFEDLGLVLLLRLLLAACLIRRTLRLGLLPLDARC